MDWRSSHSQEKGQNMKREQGLAEHRRRRGGKSEEEGPHEIVVAVIRQEVIPPTESVAGRIDACVEMAHF